MADEASESLVRSCLHLCAALHLVEKVRMAVQGEILEPLLDRVGESASAG